MRGAALPCPSDLPNLVSPHSAVGRHFTTPPPTYDPAKRVYLPLIGLSRGDPH